MRYRRKQQTNFPSPGIFQASIVIHCVFTDHFLPESLGRYIIDRLADFPASGKYVKKLYCCLPADASPAVFFHDKEFGDAPGAWALVKVAIGINHGKAGQLIVCLDQEQMPLRLYPVGVKVSVLELAIRPHVFLVEFGKVVQIELNQPPRDWFLLQRGWGKRNVKVIHAIIVIEE